MTQRSLRHQPAATGEQAGPHPDESGVHSQSADAPAKPSKSQLKREMLALQELGERLVQLQPAKLRSLPIPQELITAVELAQRIGNSRGGLRRQRQYIGRLMRQIDAGPLRDALSADGAQHRNEVALMHAAERWRERLLAEPGALSELATTHSVDEPRLAELGDLVKACHAEQAKGETGRHYRELYRCLRDALQPTPAASSNSAGSPQPE